MEWAEPLPNHCPPEEAAPPNDQIFYRVIESNEPSEIDFISHRSRWPDRMFKVNECRARSVSILDKLESCKRVRSLPTHRNKKIAELYLSKTSGVIKQTGNYIDHFSWWRFKAFNPLEHCRIVLA